MKRVFTPNRGITASLMWGASVMTMVACLFIPLVWQMLGACGDIQEKLQQREYLYQEASSAGTL